MDLPGIVIELHVPDFEPVKQFYGWLGFTVSHYEPPPRGFMVLRSTRESLNFYGGSQEVAHQSYFRRFPATTPRGYGVEIIYSHLQDP